MIDCFIHSHTFIAQEWFSIRKADTAKKTLDWKQLWSRFP